MKAVRASNKPNICVISSPFQLRSGRLSLTKFIEILDPISNELFVITGSFFQSSDERLRIIYVKGDVKRETMPIRIFKYIRAQLSVSFELFRISKNFEFAIFCLGCTGFAVPILFAKLLGKKTVLIATESAFKCSERTHRRRSFGLGGMIFSRILGFLESISYTLLDRIVVYSESSIYYLGLNRFKNKYSSVGAWFVDINLFKMDTSIYERGNVVGYIGRFSEEKGVMNFVRSIPMVSKESAAIEFLIGGYGQLLDEIERELKSNGSYNKVKLLEWIAHDELPKYLNELKLIVIPSYSEGLPNIMLEAMACGTPVLATPVGAIPDIIKDGETGFILENNSPECIAKNVIKVLEHPNLDKIVKNARNVIEKEFTYEAAVERYRKILEELL